MTARGLTQQELVVEIRDLELELSGMAADLVYIRQELRDAGGAGWTEQAILDLEDEEGRLEESIEEMACEIADMKTGLSGEPEMLEATVP